MPYGTPPVTRRVEDGKFNRISCECYAVVRHNVDKVFPHSSAKLATSGKIFGPRTTRTPEKDDTPLV
jgi:hypothetical protein